jgi:hypothetical protein
MYADDAAIFINPIKEEVEAVKLILEVFGIFLGLHKFTKELRASN